MWCREQPKQLSMEKPRRICPACRTLDPPTEPAYGCPECGQGAALSQLGGEVPEGCPWCGDGKLELHTENACAQCGQAEVEEREVYTCPWCEGLYVARWELQNHCVICPRRPQQPEREEPPGWTPGGQGKVAYLRLECTAREDRPRINASRRCQGWQRKVERYVAGDRNAFDECLKSCFVWDRNPAAVEVERVQPYVHQPPMR